MAESYEITEKKVTHENLSKILQLQKLAYLSEAKLLNNYSIKPLTQTMEELEKEFFKIIILKVEDEQTNEIIGSVRSYKENGRVYIGKLMVHPNYQNRENWNKIIKGILY
jgi:ribosomal 30S subunit maturation factor RimM